MDYSRIIHYFTYRKTTPILSSLLWVFGPIVFLTGLIMAISSEQRRRVDWGQYVTQTNAELLTLGIIFALLGIGLFIVGFVYNYRVQAKVIKVNDNEIDQFCDYMVNYIKTQALQRLGLDEENLREAEPIMVKGYNFDGKMGEHSKMKRGRDNILRSSDYQITLFYFSKDQVHSYVRVFSIINDIFFESTEEYFYRDLVSVSTTQEQTVAGAVDCFRLTTSGGTSVTATFSSADADNVHRAISAMRNLLKSKKQTMG